MLLDLLSRELALDRAYLSKLAKTASHRYKTYCIPKRKKGLRLIEHPAKQLKTAQRWLLDNVISRLPVHISALAYRNGKNIAANAILHKDSAYLLRLDLRNFFHSLTADDIRAHLKKCGNRLPKDWDLDDTELLCCLVCRNSRLSIGAVTSPALSNTLCFPLDEAMQRLVLERGIVYSRYADDLFFSSDAPGLLLDVERDVSCLLSQLEYPRNLELNCSKTFHSSRKGRRIVTGLVLTPQGGLSLGRGLKRKIRSLVFRYPDLSPVEKNRLAGLLNFCRDVEPCFINRLILKYGPERVERARTMHKRSVLTGL